ncbi:hypothetical protein EON65_05820 [archaeon]|nr:MAG: hypothetical protein EON65_05820 [archaeon]
MHRDAIYSTTLVFVIGTILLFGGITTPLIHCLKIDMHKSTPCHSEERPSDADCLTNWEDKYIVSPMLGRQQQGMILDCLPQKERERGKGVHSACCLGQE